MVGIPVEDQAVLVSRIVITAMCVGPAGLCQVALKRAEARLGATTLVKLLSRVLKVKVVP
jgi:hypothetical protein